MQPSVFTVSVGNLTVGGTGKTPHIEYLIRYFLEKNKEVEDYKLATLSRGYGRKSKGFVLANNQITASEIGDEPMQFYQKFAANNKLENEKVNIIVCEKRVLGAQKILELFPTTKTILLDDAFQHRAIKPHFSILLSDYNRPFYEDFLLPMGRIRENRKGAKRANVVLVSKSPLDLAEEKRQSIRKKINSYTKSPVFFTSFDYDKPINLLNNEILELENDKNYSFGILTGIANYQPFQKYIEKTFGQTETQKYFPDHYNYTEKDIVFLKSSDTIWFTTEKDAVKLRPLLELFSQEERNKILIFYIPIKVVFLDKNEEKQFQELINQEKIKLK